MTCMRASLIAVVAASTHSVWAQQLKDGNPAFMSYPGISTGCETALNTTVNCPAFLAQASSEHSILDSDQVGALCSGTCTSDLLSARRQIASVCTASTDVIVYSNIVYPATFIADHSTGQYCDPQFLAWSNESTLTSNQTCSECWLGVQALQLGDPIGYDEGMASDFASLTSSCSASGYSYTVPPIYGTNATTTSPGAPGFTSPATCTGSYILKPSDDCNSVAKAMGVSTFSMLYANGLDIYCQNFDTAINTSASLCTPPACKTYTWGQFDTCSAVATQYGISLPRFLAWNPNFDSICRNAINFVGYQVCVSPPGGTIDSGSPTGPSITTGAGTAIPAPTNSFPETRACGGWYTNMLTLSQVQTGDNCGKLSITFSIILSDFYFLNPEVYTNCTNLLLGVAYCVFPVGNIATYSGYIAPPTMPITVPPATFSSVNTANPSTTVHANPGYVFQQLPMASGTIQGCASYANFNDNTTDASLNSCSYIAYAYGVELSDLLAWNPSLSKDATACALQRGLSYCVQKTETTTFVPDGNYCASIADDASIPLAQLKTWNPWLGSNCDTALFANLDENDLRAVCIGISSTAPTGSPTAEPSSTSSGTKTSSVSTGPTQTGIVPGCQQFYTVQSGDGCATIQSTFGITFADFYTWNPSIGSNCENLWLGYSYCVKAPASSTTTSGGVAPPGPTQPGEAANCNEYYVVQSGDGCPKIQSQFGITFQQLYQWNPAIGSDCTNLWLGYAVCVGVSS
ncbi:hypothetical protein B0T24DRAFT_707942 [Lasiosphaeria ovina]|uniref:LysM domain-containing protein n=1 Tax=Lasiosphaeria ovina TaxID=92902 RepID=A0AAE0K3F9_9PEZI|nr:hypothetical protein B0T24DRAFT_707942 [Lasiosphaeria ovina]